LGGSERAIWGRLLHDALFPLQLFPLLRPPILEPDFDLPLGQLEALGDFLFPRNGDVLVQSELVLQLNPLGVIVNNSILVFGARFILRHFPPPKLLVQLSSSTAINNNNRDRQSNRQTHRQTEGKERPSGGRPEQWSAINQSIFLPLSLFYYYYYYY